MKKIVFVPLDERPCNRLYPKMIADLRQDLCLMMPSVDILGHKKQPANITAIWEFVRQQAGQADGFVFSLEMLFYGGLLPSRLHHFDESWQERCLAFLRQIKQENPDKPIYAFQLIMRTPRYSSSDEEPDYYGLWGEQLFRRAYLLDQKERVGLNEAEERELKQLSDIPEAYIEDYEKRRAYNIQLNLKVLDLVKEGTLDFLAIPQDDSSPYGYTARDQKKVTQKIADFRLQQRVLMYPGADEAGCSLLARMVSMMDGQRIKVYPYYASTLGPTIVPLYEDRIMFESLISHLLVCHCQRVMNWQEAEVILAINCPGKVMQEAREQPHQDITYRSHRQLAAFVDQLQGFIKAGKPVALADCAYANGGDLELIGLLDECRLWDDLVCYYGWNTHCNTLGTTIAQLVMAPDAPKKKQLMLYHILEDGFYQAVIRQETTRRLAAPLSYFDLQDQTGKIAVQEASDLMALAKKNLLHSFKDIEIKKIEVIHPWNRMFEVELRLWLS